MLLLATLACSTPTTLDAPAAMTWTGSGRIEVEASVLDADGEPMEDQTITASSSSAPEVVKVGNDGSLICSRNGSSSVTLQSGQLTATTQVLCAIVDSIEAPDSLRVLLEEGTEQNLRLDYAVKGPKGVDEIPVSVTSSKPEVVSVSEGGGLTVLQFGLAELTIAASDKAHVVTVEVGRELDRHAGMKVKDGDSTGIAVEAGRYVATVHSDQPVTLAFGGSECETDEGTELELECTVPGASTVKVENPGLLGMGGGTATVNVKLIQLP